MLWCGLAAMLLLPTGIARAAGPDPYGILLKPLPEKLAVLTFDDASRLSSKPHGFMHGSNQGTVQETIWKQLATAPHP
ncbi:MAG: hypothetical protein WCK89_03535 [bacterium]